jgi:hypothetical protein
MAKDDFDFDSPTANDDDGALVSETTFKGRPVLVLKRTPDDKYPLSMGLGKLKLCLENFQVIEAFVKKHDK